MTSGTLLPAPATAADVQELVRDAGARAAPLRVRAAGSWMDAGAPTECAETLAIGRLTGIVDYTPGDLTLTARAATPLSEIARITNAEGQWLALDPYGSPHGTIGATVATGSSGALASAFGTVRDAVLGLEVVTGTGALVRGGGRVVKNVAGFDLCRLFTGAWGTLGVVTEVTVRLRALPEEERSIALEVGAGALSDVLARLRAATFTPYAAQLLSAPLAARLGVSADTALLLRLGGNADALDAQERCLAPLGAIGRTAPALWEHLRTAEYPNAIVVRLSRAPSRLDEVWQSASSATSDVPGALVHACVARGIVRVILPGDGSAEPALQALSTCGHVVVPERLPAAWWPRLHVGQHDAGLARRVRAAFDPGRLLNRGILAEGA